MSKVRDGTGRPGWFTKREMALIFDVTEKFFDHEIRPLTRGVGERKEGVQLKFFARAFLDAWAAAKRKAPALVGSNGNSGDDEPSGPPTAALERWQALKADREAIKLEIDRKSFVAVEYVREAFTAVAACFRRACDTLQRQFGRDAHEVIEEAVRDAERELEARFG